MLISPNIFVLNLRSYLELAWDNEQEFLANFWEWDKYDEMQLLEFYVSDDTCKVIVLAADGQTLTTTINTEEYLEWANDIAQLSA